MCANWYQKRPNINTGKIVPEMNKINMLKINGLIKRQILAAQQPKIAIVLQAINNGIPRLE